MKILSLALRFAVVAFLVFESAAPARADFPIPGLPTCDRPTQAPIDGGASLLLAGGAAYAVRRIRGRK